MMYQRSGETWTAPGALAAVRANFNSSGGNGIGRSWTVSGLSLSSSRPATDTFRLTHNLGHSDYVTIVHAEGSPRGSNFPGVSTINEYDNYVDIVCSPQYTDTTLFITMFGRNKLVPLP